MKYGPCPAREKNIEMEEVCTIIERDNALLCRQRQMWGLFVLLGTRNGHKLPLHRFVNISFYHRFNTIWFLLLIETIR